MSMLSDAPAPRLREFALLGLLALLWGSSYALIRVALESFPPVTLIAIRVSVATVFILALVAWRGERLPRDAATWGRLLVQSLLNSVGAWLVLAWGQQHVESGLAGVLNSTSPIFVFLIASALSGRVGEMSKFAGAVLGLGGVVLIVGAGALEGLGKNVLAELAVLSGAMMYGGAAIYGRRFAHLPPTVTAAGTMIWASVILVPLSIVVDRPWTLAVSETSLAAALTLGVVCTGLALLIYFRLVVTIGSMGAASQAYLRAGISVVLGMAVFGESFRPEIAAGLVLAVAGVAMINWPRRPAAAPRRPA
ncbi:MAG: DMT family transporter [Flavobacteriaceae bacterium]